MRGNYRSAQALLVDLYHRSPTFDVAASLADAESRLGDHARAARYFALALATVPPKEKAETSARIRGLLEAEVQRVATLRLVVNRESAEIFVDGETAGTFPQISELYVNPGKRTLRARNGQATDEREIDAVAGASMRVSFELPSDVEASPSPPVAPEPRESAVGTPTPGTPPAQERANWLPAGVSAGLALVAVSVGTGFAIDAAGAKSDGEKKRQDAVGAFGSDNACSLPAAAGSPICDDLTDLQERRQSSNKAATVSFVLGGVFAAAAVGSYFLWARPSSQNGRSPRVGAWIDGKGGSFSFEGSF